MARRVTLAQRFGYEFDKTMSAGPIALIGWLAVASLAGVFVTGVVLTLTHLAPEGSPSYSFPEALWQALLHTIDTGDLENDHGWWLRAVELTVTIWGVLIVSSLIGFLGAGVLERLNELRRGRSIVLERGHTLILNWSDAVFDVIQQLSVAAKEAKRRRTVVVLAPKDKVEMEDAIATRVRKHPHVSVICRNGDPTDLHDLQIANVDEARSIIVVSPDDGNPDIRNIKTVMALSRAADLQTPARNIVAEFRDSSNVEAVQVISAEGIKAVMADDLISRIIVHSSRQSGLSEVYAELLSYEGAEICTVPDLPIVGLTFREALLAYEEGALIGLSHGGKAVLNPPMDTKIAIGVEGIFVAETSTTIHRAKKAAHVDDAAIVTERASPERAERALILGWNRRGPAVVSELSRYMAANSLITIVADTPRFAELAPALRLPVDNVRLDHSVADTADRSVIRTLNVSACNHVIVLACSDDMDAESADTRTLVTLLHLRQAIADAGNRFTVVSEILNEHNCALAQTARADDFVVSNRLTSLMLTQISENSELLQIFAEILDEEGAEIYMRPAKDYVELERPVTFATVVAAAAARGESTFGYRCRRGAADSGLKLNPRKGQTVTFQAGDSIVVVANENSATN